MPIIKKALIFAENIPIIISWSCVSLKQADESRDTTARQIWQLAQNTHGLIGDIMYCTTAYISYIFVSCTERQSSFDCCTYLMFWSLSLADRTHVTIYYFLVSKLDCK